MRRSRKSGVAIENVMLGLIIILIFTGALWYAYAKASSYIERKSVSDYVQIFSNETRYFVSRAMTGNSANDTDRLHEYLEGMSVRYGNLPTDLGAGTPYPEHVLLPHGGIINPVLFDGSTANLAGNFQIMLMWGAFPNGNVSKGRKLCNALSGGVPPGTSVALDDAEPSEGPLGSQYAVVIKNCEAAVPTLNIYYEN